eukprot:TRINITY_DN95864_c0_g1_i1.p1 TRINITY_DN95864_c0_g1~~TRINITY_DN95864_c0_g1_i1.p1  ORF type:complete len:579 (+),score=158.54 TRINITY_DN95864_c0_g1_i1:63-1799(+)
MPDLVSPFSLGLEKSKHLPEADSYLKEKFAKLRAAKAKSKSSATRKASAQSASNGGYKTSANSALESLKNGKSAPQSDKIVLKETRSSEPEKTTKPPVDEDDEDLDDDERELLGLSRRKVQDPIPEAVTQTEKSEGAASKKDPEPQSAPSAGAPPLWLSDAGPALRLAATGTTHTSRRTCDEGHALSCYAIGRSAALCDRCDFMQRPGDIVFGCRVCDAEICASCAVETASSPEDAKDDLEVIARVAKAAGRMGSRFIATPNGALLDTEPEKEKEAKAISHSSAQAIPLRPDSTDGGSSSSSKPQRPKRANEVDESHWKLPSTRVSDLATPTRNGRRDLLGEMLAEQEQLLQRRRLERHEAAEAAAATADVAKSTSSSRSRSGVAAASEQQDVAFGSEKKNAEASDINLMDENAARERPSWAVELDTARARCVTEPESFEPMERSFDLTLTLAGDFVDELARGYAQPWFQELVQKCAKDCGYDREKFLVRLQDVAFEVQRPILENWGFEGDEQGLYDMTSILREHLQGTGKEGVPSWLQERIDQCLTLLFGGVEGGMLSSMADHAAALGSSTANLSCA